MDRALRRSARPQRRSDRLDRAHPVLRDAQLRAARDGELPDVPGAFRAGAAPEHRGGSASRRGRRLSRIEQALKRDDSRFRFLLEHDVFRKPVPTFRRHALFFGPMTTPGAGGPVDLTIRAPDGLRLHARRYGARNDATLPVLCLPGLSRTAEDFAERAVALAADTAEPRCVVAMDYRGRGDSEYDRDHTNYSLPVELADVLAVMTALELAPVIVVGTSRGGILA